MKRFEINSDFVKSLVFGLLENIAKAKNEGNAEKIQRAEKQLEIVTKNIVKELAQKFAAKN